MENLIEYKNLEESEVVKTKDLVLEYIKSINLDLSFQDIDNELGSFPAKYSDPNGIFIIAKDGNHIIGCVGFKKLDSKICEMKRLFVKENYKGKGIGKKLVEIIINEAKVKGYKKMRLDTLKTMENAITLYYKTGFYEIAPYVYNPLEGAIYLEKTL
jgi:ribosomal protein S18 acetylase RimI-like enzyme